MHGKHHEKNIVVKLDKVTKYFLIDQDDRDTLQARFIDPLNILKKFKKHPKHKFIALENISFDVEKGDFVGIIGKNGSGKSTLLKIIAGIYEANEGKIAVKGHIVPFLELGVGFNPELSARENVFLNGTILGMTRKQIKERFDSIIAFAELQEFTEVQIKYFSSGMMVRLAFSIAMQADGDIYIMDEVLAVGDANFQSKCIEKLNELIKEKKTILFVSHNEAAVKKYCNKVIYLKDHKIENIGDASKLVKEYDEDMDIKPDNVMTRGTKI